MGAPIGNLGAAANALPGFMTGKRGGKKKSSRSSKRSKKKRY